MEALSLNIIQKTTIKENNIINLQTVKAKPFLKWAGGKNQLIKEIEKKYPEKNSVKKYVEPFVGGGAVFFDIIYKFNFEEIYISDINSELINTYCVIRDDVEKLVGILSKIQDEYMKLDENNKKIYYLEKRKCFNNINQKNNDILKAALMIFLNKTCFNGLYRVNKKGFFNVPMGKYKNPLICDKNNLYAIYDKLKNVKISCGDYKESIDFIDNNTFVYIDPPYKPLNKTSNFTAYTKDSFNDEKQIELSNFIKEIDKKGAKFLLSNSDPKNFDENNDFFEKIYSSFKIKRVNANRMINSKASGRGKIKELLISNI